MFMPILSGLVVSVDAFFIGLSLGLQKGCRFVYLALINVFLFALCVLGFLIAGQIYERIPFEPDYVVGFAFIALGLWTILYYFVSEQLRRRKGGDEANISPKTFAIVGLVMSGEAMLITMGITFLFLPHSSFAIPLTVALAHFGYSALSFHLARTKRMRRIPPALSNVVSGLALIIYGTMALFLDLGELFT
ncbi:MAG: manganese efflux pump [Oscillospiraceae bacterium]|nr:manganese efflux pump [Oscillospiraceae bacterium]